MQRLYRIIQREEWRRVEGAEWFAPADLAAVGFIHLCTVEQLPFVRERHFGGVADLLVMEIDGEALGGDLRWEVSEEGMPPFPHCYGAIARRAIVGVAIVRVSEVE